MSGRPAWLRRYGWTMAPALAAILAATGALGAEEGSPPAAGPAPAAAAQPAYQLADGPFPVEIGAKVTLRDAKREKDLGVSGTWPKGDGPFPVIVFSHGAGGSGTAYWPLVRFWAGHGYVILAPTHADSLSLADRNEEAKGGMVGIIARLLNDPKGWENRARDVSLVIDSLSEIERQTPALKGKMDARRLGVGGHSYGAYTSQLIAGATVNIPGGEKGKSFADPRPVAILLLSAQGRGQMGLTEGSWAALKRPMMVMTGSRDRGALGQGPEAKLDPFRFAPPGDKYGVLVEDATHMSFLGRLTEGGGGTGLRALLGEELAKGTDQKAVFSHIKVATIAFWDAYLKGEEKAKAYLQSDQLKAFSKGALRLDRK